MHGYKETPQVSYIEGTVTDREELDLEALVGADECTVTLELNNGKINEFNETMKAYCEENKWYYVNVAEAFRDENGAVTREDILLRLNRLSSLMSIMIIKLKAGKYPRESG